MGKKKNVDMSVDPSEKVVSAKTETKKKMTIWEDLYTDLAPHVASALRDARVKPDQLKLMADGEITAIEGIGEVGLEEIRAKYAADAVIEEADRPQETLVEEAQPTTPRKPRHPNRGGKKIKAMKGKVDRTKLYSLDEAVKLAKETNITGFDATLTLHLNLREKMSRIELTFPHLAGAAKKIAIADDKLLEDIDAGKLDFDILLATPTMMPKLAKYAKVLGPKGLMPSPKSGTITPNPEAKRKEFEGGKTVIKGEAKFPLMHVVVGKLSQPDKELLANLQTVLDAVKTKNIVKATLASTMSPGIKLLIQ